MIYEPKPISDWVWLFGGYQQSLVAESGCEMVWRRIRRYSTGTLCIQLREWNTDPKAVAAFIRRNSIDRPRIVIGGYSWGGDCAIDLCIALAKLGLAVMELISCDAVFRSGLFSTRFTLNPLSLTNIPKFTIPDNVEHVTAFAQNKVRPAGHRIFRTDGSEIARKMIDCRHDEIDECEDFAEAVQAATARLAA